MGARFRKSLPQRQWCVLRIRPMLPTRLPAQFCNRLTLALLSVSLFATSVFAARPYRGGAVATAYAPASEAALAMLNQGGNAVDAAVAAAFVAGVAGPYHNGIGGGGFALVYDTHEKKTRVLDFREVAPQAASHDMYLRDGKAVPELSRDGATSVAVPGAVAGYLELLSHYGHLKPSVVLAPAIRLARRGIWVTPKYQSMVTMRVDCLKKDPDAARIFLRPNAKGEPDVPAIGTLLPNPELAKTLEAIAQHGDAAFYGGRVAQAIATTVHDGKGLLTLDDLKRYHPRWRDPVEGSYRGHHIATMPPPSAGGVAVLQVLGELEALTPQGFVRGDVQATHDLIEAMRRSYADRAKYLGDPAFVDIPLAKLVSAEHLAELAHSIDPKHATDSRSLQALSSPSTPPHSVDAGDFQPSPRNTTHMSVIDKDGNAVALTTTINYAFGSCVVAHGTGILLNDQMDDFAAQPMTPNVYGLVTGEANAIAPGKVPLSSMSPTLVFQKDAPDQVMLAVGSPGGPTIPTVTLQVISNVIDQKLDLPRAVAAGRLHEQWLPDVVMLERLGLEPSTQHALEAMGHKFQSVNFLGDAEAVMVDPVTHLRSSSSDPRGEGAGLGQE